MISGFNPHAFTRGMAVESGLRRNSCGEPVARVQEEITGLNLANRALY